MMSDVRPRILIVDDREENRYVLCRVLQQAGYDCTEIGSGSEALKAAQHFPISWFWMCGFRICPAMTCAAESSRTRAPRKYPSCRFPLRLFPARIAPALW